MLGGVSDLILTDATDTGAGGSNLGGFMDDGDRSSGGSRWPREETLALLKIRSDMDLAFRDSSLKGPLWDEVSRKLAELGYHRNAKKCKEKFENVYKYHKRTKDGRSTKPDGKTYRFFDQLQAIENQPSFTTHPPASTLQSPEIPNSQPHPFHDFVSNSTSSWSSTSSDEEEDSKKRKRKWKGFFERLMQEVIHNQEILQKAFLEAIETRDRDRMAREESWRMQEMARINRNQEILLQERSISAAKDAALISFLQKISSDHKIPTEIPVNSTPPAQPTVIPPVSSTPTNLGAIVAVNTSTEVCVTPSTSSSRWPKAEVQALIKLRTDLDMKYQESGPKGPLWEEISSGMSSLGYFRNAKRCKEKWENINKYFKKVKESNKKRSHDSKTCPYFHQLDALYREKILRIEGPSNVGNATNAILSNQENADPLVPMMVRPEQQWPMVPEMNEEMEGEDEDDDEEDEMEGEDEG